MGLRTLTAAVALLSGWIVPGHAQIVFPPGDATLRGRIFDTVTNAAIPRTHICRVYSVPIYGSAMRCGRVDTLGWYVFDSLPAGPNPITVACPGRRLMDRGKLIGADTIDLKPGETRQIDFRSDATGCDPRPVRVVRGAFHGHYSSGFEQSELILCASEFRTVVPDTAGLSEFEFRAWVDWPPSGKAPGSPTKWPRPRKVYPPWNYPQYFVHWVGVLEGPGHYGHLGVSGFRFILDSIIEVQTPKDSDCKPRPR